MRLTIYRKFLLVLVPSFAVLAAVTVAILFRIGWNFGEEAMAWRVGKLGGRVAGALERLNAVHSPRLAEELLATLGTDRAIVCVELRGTNPAAPLIAAYPAQLGCDRESTEMSISIPVADAQALMTFEYTDRDLVRVTRGRVVITLIVLVATFLATLASASFGFRTIVSRRLTRLHRAMTQSASTAKRRQIDAGGADELSEIIGAYNTLVRSEQAREQLLLERNEQLSDDGRRDPLTGMYNRRHFEAWAADYSSDPLRRQQVGVISLLDLDHFKRINDTHGHTVGDEVLVAIAKRLMNVLRADDLLVRWGGEEILIVSLGAQPAELLARRLLAVVGAEPINTSVGELAVTASIGTARLPLRAGDIDLPLERALVLCDHALYLAKNSGRYRAVCIGSLSIDNPMQLAALDGDLQAAAASGLVKLSEVLPDAYPAPAQQEA